MRKVDANQVPSHLGYTHVVFFEFLERLTMKSHTQLAQHCHFIRKIFTCMRYVLKLNDAFDGVVMLYFFSHFPDVILERKMEHLV